MKKLLFTILLLSTIALFLPGKVEPANIKDQISFGAQMAKKGNWFEAVYRWQKALESEPENYKLHNNLAVAYEALGKYEEAEKAYQSAMKYSKNNREIKENYKQFMKFYSQYKSSEKGPNEKEMDRSDSPVNPGD